MNKEMRSPASTKLTFQEEGDKKHKYYFRYEYSKENKVGPKES